MTTAPTPAPSRSPFTLLLLSLFALYVIWGSTYFAIRVALVDLPPLGMAGLRFLLAGGVLYAIERLRGQARPPAKVWLHGALMGLLLLGMGNGFVVMAQRSVASSLAAVAVATMPLFAGLWSRLFGVAPSRSEWLGLVVGFVGVILLSGEGDFRASPLGALLLILAPASWALGSVLSRRLTLASGFMGSAVQMLMGGVLLTLGALVHGERWPTQVGAASLGAFAYLVVFGSILAFSAYGYLLRNTRTAVATSYAYVNPVIAIALGMSLGGEHIGVRGLIGAGVILFGVVLVTLGRAKSAPQPSAPAQDGTQAQAAAAPAPEGLQVARLDPAPEVSRLHSGSPGEGIGGASERAIAEPSQGRVGSGEVPAAAVLGLSSSADVERAVASDPNALATATGAGAALGPESLPTGGQGNPPGTPPAP